MSFAGGVMLCAFGTFWGAEGAGVSWPGSDSAILVLVLLYGFVAVLLAASVRRAARSRN